jgi:ribosomal protein S18 acetylase RimI-like enzyme
MGKDLSYRLGTHSDLEQLKDLGILAYGEFSEILRPEKWDLMHTSLSNETNLLKLIETARVFVCTDGDTLVGMAYLVPKNNPTHIFPAEWAYIRLVGVHPRYRGMGIAQKLTQQCIEFAKASGEATIGLHTSEMMDAARHIYEGFGFKKVREIDNPFGVKYWLYSFEL